MNIKKLLGIALSITSVGTFAAACDFSNIYLINDTATTLYINKISSKHGSIFREDGGSIISDSTEKFTVMNTAIDVPIAVNVEFRTQNHQYGNIYFTLENSGDACRFTPQIIHNKFSISSAQKSNNEIYFTINPGR